MRLRTAAVCLGAFVLLLVACGGSDGPPDGPYLYVTSLELGYAEAPGGPVPSNLQARICASYDSGAPALNSEISASATGAGVVSVERQAGFTDAQGCVRIDWRIDRLGRYAVRVQRVWSAGVEYYAGANEKSRETIDVTDFPKRLGEQ